MPSVEQLRTRIQKSIRDTLTDNSGKPLGQRRFQEVAGITLNEIRRSGLTYSQHLEAIGVQPNEMTKALPDDELFEMLARLTIECGQYPTITQLMGKRAADRNFPSPDAFTKFGNRSERVARLLSFSQGTPGLEGAVTILKRESTNEKSNDEGVEDISRPSEDGEVYLLKLGKHYKIGKTNCFGRRERELTIQMPERARTIHTIRTDDPTGIERYWHERFAAK